ncbi:MAG: LysR family transcriptional regulator [Roseibium sp.]|uniref:LysR family transcriptional regulator n=1 Tax=Roseibium sp. TaxID=1936156 RepID=UPI003D9C1BD2
MRNINIRSVDLNLLVAFDALYKERSVTRAASRIALTQPTVSGMLKRLRDTFDDDLFVRTSHGIVPTPRADAIAPRVADLLDDIGLLLSPDDFDPASSAFTVRVCGSDYLLHTILDTFAESVLQTAPRARVSVLPRPAEGIARQLESGEIDLILSDRELTVPDLPARFLYRDDFVCLSSYADIADGDDISLDRFCEREHGFVDPTGGSFHGPIDDALEAVGRKRNMVLAVPGFAMLLQLMKSRPMLAFVPVRIAAAFDHGFSRVRTPLDLPHLEIVASWHPRMTRDPKHKWLRETLVSIANA